jgi:hypothetical protein
VQSLQWLIHPFCFDALGSACSLMRSAIAPGHSNWP